MSRLGNVIGGKLILKNGGALDLRNGTKKKRKKRHGLAVQQLQALQQAQEALKKEEEDCCKSNEWLSDVDDRNESQRKTLLEGTLTPAEKRYREQVAKLEIKRAAKLAVKSHRQRLEEFNKYLANLSEHYDIPKVGPG